MDENDLESVIKFLRDEKGLKINDIIDAVGLINSRPYFYEMRGGKKKPFQKKLLLEKIKTALPEHFQQDGANPIESERQNKASNVSGPGIELRYIELLEKSVEEIRAERDKLKSENESLVREIREMMNGRQQEAS